MGNTGIIKYYNPNKGYGFIKNIYAEEEIFFHISDVYEYEKEKINENIVVVYSKDKDKKQRDKAINISIPAMVKKKQ